MKRTAKELRDHVARMTQPYLNSLLGSKRPIAIDWRLDPMPRPSVRTFDPSETALLREVLEKYSKIVENKKVIDLRKPYRILCLDGGGVRGALTAALLKRICEKNPDFLNHVDLICGTSAGGILSLLLSAGYSPQECNEVYGFAAKHIFGHNPWRVINPFRAKYSDRAKQELMMHYFGDRTMGDLEKTCAVVAFRLDGRKSKTHSFFNKEGWRPAVFSNMPKASGFVEPDLDLKVWDAAMCTSAAPTYFPVFRGYTDGGIVANNPSIIAISKAVAHYRNVTPKNIALLSIGAGYVPLHTNVFSSLDSDATSLADSSNNTASSGSYSSNYSSGLGPAAATSSSHKPQQQREGGREGSNDMGQLLGESGGTKRRNSRSRSLLNHADWGIKQWMPFLIDLLLDGDSVTTEMAAHYLLDGHGMYHRLDPRLPRQIALDDVTAMQDLREFAQTVDLTETLRFIEENFAYDDSTFDNELHNSLDHASTYNEAWMASSNLYPF